MRKHFWTTVIDNEGRPIQNASVYIYLAGSESAANVFSTEYGGNYSSVLPQLTTNSQGFFEFWIADSSESGGYAYTQKFKIKIIKSGTLNFVIDYVDVFNTSIPDSVDENDTDTTKDKLVSNYLANLWTTHISTSADRNTIVHGLQRVNNTSEDTTYNKLLNNNLAKNWTDTRTKYNRGFQSIASSYVTNEIAGDNQNNHKVKIDISDYISNDEQDVMFQLTTFGYNNLTTNYDEKFHFKILIYFTSEDSGTNSHVDYSEIAKEGCTFDSVSINSTNIEVQFDTTHSITAFTNILEFYDVNNRGYY